MNSQLVVGFTATVALTFLAFVFVLTQSALATTSITRIESLDDEPEWRKDRVLALLGKPQETLSTIRLLVLGTRLVQMAVVTMSAAHVVGAAGIVLSVFVNVCLVFVVAEAVPRTFGVLRADRVALSLGPMVALVMGFWPIRLLSKLLLRLASVALPMEATRSGRYSMPSEIIALADAAVEDDVLAESDRDLIESVIEFGETVVREVMVPRTDMITIEADLSVEAALAVTSSVGFSRVPVTRDNTDDVVGLAYVKDLIKAEMDEREDAVVSSLLRPPRFVPETKRVAPLLREMQRDSFHMAMVVDEYGGIAGLVTLEDLIEEIVGEIVDEYDVEEPLLERQSDGMLRVDGRMLIDELNDLAGLELPSGDWDTVGGLVFDRFGRVPREGETCDCDGYALRVERVQGRRITRVMVLRPSSLEETTA